MLRSIRLISFAMLLVVGSECAWGVDTDVALVNTTNRLGLTNAGIKLSLLRNKRVIDEIKLTESQQKEIAPINTEFQAKMRALAAKQVPRLAKLDGQEREKGIHESQVEDTEIAQGVAKQLDKILDSEQKARLDQLTVQRMGVNALRVVTTAEQVGLSTTQFDKITEIYLASRRPPADLSSLTVEGRNKVAEELRERQGHVKRDQLAVLTPEQQKKFDALKGKEFDFETGADHPRRPLAEEKEREKK